MLHHNQGIDHQITPEIHLEDHELSCHSKVVLHLVLDLVVEEGRLRDPEVEVRCRIQVYITVPMLD